MKKLLQHFLKFGVVGVTAYLVDYFLLLVLSQRLNWNSVFSAAISYSVSTVYNYILSMKFIYTSRDELSKKREFSIFFGLAAIGLVINEILIAAGVALFGDGPRALTVLKLTSALIVAVWNFFSRERWLDADRPNLSGDTKE